jgi:serine/threonine-protein kinase
LQRRLVLPAREVADLLDQVSEGLTVAHGAGVVHRDIKPQNLFLTSEGAWKILDFGVAADRSAESGADLMGTPAYMAPEQLSSAAPVDHRADVYALAVVAYRALTGRPAFSGRDSIAIVNRVLNSTPPPPSSLVGVNEQVDVVLLKAMSRTAAARFDDVRSFARSFREAVERS